MPFEVMIFKVAFNFYYSQLPMIVVIQCFLSQNVQLSSSNCSWIRLSLTEVDEHSCLVHHLGEVRVLFLGKPIR